MPDEGLHPIYDAMTDADPPVAHAGYGGRKSRPFILRLLLACATIMTMAWVAVADSIGWLLRPVAARFERDGRGDGWRRWLTSFGPYTTLVLLAVPLLIVEPLKLVALYVMGRRHVAAGLFILVLAFCAGLFVIDRIFEMNREKLLGIGWLARLHEAWTALLQDARDTARRSSTWRGIQRVMHDIRRRRRR